MHVILLQDVPKVGQKFDIKNVADGYASNYLIPRRLAERATEERISRIKEIKSREVKEKEIEISLLHKNLAALKNAVVTFTAKASEAGHLYEGIHANDITDALKKQHRIDISPSMLELPHPLKSVGEHTIVIQAQNHRGSVKVLVVAA